MRPHAQHANGLLLLEHRLHQLTLDVDSPRIGAIQVPNQFLIGWGNLKRIMGDQLQKLLGLRLKTGGRQLLGILLRLLRVNDAPSHQSSSLALLASGSAMPCLMDSRIPGTDNRYRVS